MLWLKCPSTIHQISHSHRAHFGQIRWLVTLKHAPSKETLESKFNFHCIVCHSSHACRSHIDHITIYRGQVEGLIISVYARSKSNPGILPLLRLQHTPFTSCMKLSCWSQCLILHGSPFPTHLIANAHTIITIAPTSNLCLATHPRPASLAALPASPNPAVPPGPLLKAATSGEHCPAEPAPSPSKLGNTCPVAASTRFLLIHSQFSASNSGHSARNFTPPSPAFTAPTPFTVAMLPFTALMELPPPVVFHHLERAASQRRSDSGRESEPVVISSEVMKDIRPMRMVLTSQAGLKDLGWKSEMERQRRVEGWKRPVLFIVSAGFSIRKHSSKGQWSCNYCYKALRICW